MAVDKRPKKGKRTDSNDMRGLRMRLADAEEIVADESITPADVVDEDLETIQEKVELAKFRRGMIKRTISRFDSCRGAQDVFADFSIDAAKATVMEMQLAFSSGDRQRAAETVLNRALGKPVDRVMSIGMQVSSKSDPELNDDIAKLLVELGFEGGEGKNSPFTFGGEEQKRFQPTPDVQTEPRIEWRSGIPRKIYNVDSEG